MRIARIGVIGAGTMGSGIAALAASAGIPVELLDVPGDDGGDAPARAGLERALKARPAAFMDARRAALVRTGTIRDDLERLDGCDLVIEAIVEQLAPKQELYARLEPILGPETVVASNTSGIPIAALANERSPEFRRRFLGMHFFNPPRYLHLVELIPTVDTSPEAQRAVQRFAERVLGKGVVVARDVPGFVANRLGVYGLVYTIRLMERFDLSIDEVDALTGALIGRPKSATFRTGDITGLDVLGHVTSGLARATGEDFAMPDWVQQLVAGGRLGEKSGAGFYQKQGKQISTLDWRTGEYQPQRTDALPGEVARLERVPLAERLRQLVELPGREGDFLRALLFGTYHYVLHTAPAVAYDIMAVDHALEWGFGWEMGPFAQMDAIGLDRVRAGIHALGLSEPPLLAAARTGFYRAAGASHEVLALNGEYVAPPATPGRIQAAALREGRTLIHETADAALLDMGEGVALLEFRTKMNTIGQGVLDELAEALERVGREGWNGLVVGNDDPRTFSAGADLMAVAAVALRGQWTELEQAVRRFQQATSSIREAPFPVVVAPFGLTLGGGAEMLLHADQVQAHAELYTGLVEVGVGLLPAGGGTKELLFRFTEALEPYPEADPFEAVKRAFQAIAMAKTSTSALDARAMGFLRPRDRISMNRDFLLADARQRVIDLASDYVSPVPRTIRALGTEGLGNLRYGVWAMREARQVSDHDVAIGNRVAYVLCGGDGPPRTVTEQDILDLECEAFLALLGTPQTQARIKYMLETGKPLRN